MNRVKPEQWFWRNRVRPVLSKIGGLHFDRVESSTARNIPDVTITTAAGHGWLELKVAHLCRNNLTLTTLTPGQVSWMRGRGKLCGRVWVLVWCEKLDKQWLFGYNEIVRLTTPLPLQDAGNLSVAQDGSPVPWPDQLSNVFK